jgi:hypothetical protein
MDKSSLKSSNIRGRFFHLVGGKRDFCNGVHPFMHGTTLPVLIFLGPHFTRAGKDADGLVHALHYDLQSSHMQALNNKGGDGSKPTIAKRFELST